MCLTTVVLLCIHKLDGTADTGRKQRHYILTSLVLSQGMGLRSYFSLPFMYPVIVSLIVVGICGWLYASAISTASALMKLKAELNY